MYLLVANVVLELRRTNPHKRVPGWVEGTPADWLFLSAVTVGEIQAGIEVTREQDAAKADELAAWLDRIVLSYNVLPMDVDVFREWAVLKHRKSDALIEDAMIAATARVRGLTVATRNVRDFRNLNVDLPNPFESG